MTSFVSAEFWRRNVPLCISSSAF